MRLPTIPGIVLNYPHKVATYTAPAPRTWFGRTWHIFQRARWKRERAELLEWRRTALQGAVCCVCGVNVNPEKCAVQWTEGPTKRTRLNPRVWCDEHAAWWDGIDWPRPGSGPE